MTGSSRSSTPTAGRCSPDARSSTEQAASRQSRKSTPSTTARKHGFRIGVCGGSVVFRAARVATRASRAPCGAPDPAYPQLPPPFRGSTGWKNRDPRRGRSGAATDGSSRAAGCARLRPAVPVNVPGGTQGDLVRLAGLVPNAQLPGAGCASAPRAGTATPEVSRRNGVRYAPRQLRKALDSFRTSPGLARSPERHGAPGPIACLPPEREDLVLRGAPQGARRLRGAKTARPP